MGQVEAICYELAEVSRCHTCDAPLLPEDIYFDSVPNHPEQVQLDCGMCGHTQTRLIIRVEVPPYDNQFNFASVVALSLALLATFICPHPLCGTGLDGVDLHSASLLGTHCWLSVSCQACQGMFDVVATHDSSQRVFTQPVSANDVISAHVTLAGTETISQLFPDMPLRPAAVSASHFVPNPGGVPCPCEACAHLKQGGESS